MIPMAAAEQTVPVRLRVDADPHDELEYQLMTGEAVALDLRPAPFVLRAAGAIIDFLVYFGSYALIMLFVFPVLVETLSLDDAVIAATSITLLVIAIVIAPTAVETIFRGRSLGKLAIGSRIVRDDGGAIGFRHAFIRALVGVLEIYGTFGGIAAVTAIVSVRSKRLGDLLAGTYSQYERVSSAPRPVYGVPVELEEWATTADVARLPNALARRVAQFLEQASRLTPETRVRISRELATEVAIYVAPVPVTEAELFLAGVAAVRRDREAAALDLERRGLVSLAPVLTGLPHGFPTRD